MRTPFEHGDRSPTHGSLLSQHITYLMGVGCTLVSYERDTYGTFGAVLKSVDGLPFMFTSRGIAPWKPPMDNSQPHVSFQKRLLDTWNTIHVLGIEPAGDPVAFYVFHAEAVRYHAGNFKAEGYSPYNDYKGAQGAKCVFVNFPLSLGIKWDPKQPLATVWSQLKERYSDQKKHQVCFWTGDGKAVK